RGIGGARKAGSVGAGAGGRGAGRKVLAAAAAGSSSAIEIASSADWKVEHRVLSLVKMGFKRQEAETALSSSPSGEVMGHDTLTRLLEPLRPRPGISAVSAGLGPEGGVGAASEDDGSMSTRNEEELVLSSIFGDQAFRVVGGRGGAGGALRWEVDAALEFEGGGISPDTTIVFLFQKRKRYPHEAPLVLVTNESLPPGLARRLTEAANTQAAAMAGADPIVHSLVGWLQGASKACHAAFLAEVRQREERAAAEKKERAAAARTNKKGPKASRQQQQQQQQAKA
ncbi:unnamed protein product, partial [Scytosiphon promiscuus]